MDDKNFTFKTPEAKIDFKLRSVVASLEYVKDSELLEGDKEMIEDCVEELKEVTELIKDLNNKI